MPSPKCSCFNSIDEMTTDLGILKHLDGLIDSMNNFNSLQNNLEKLQNDFEINDKIIFQNSTKKLTNFCINCINEFNIVFEEQKLFILTTINKLERKLITFYHKADASIERSMCCDYCYGYINFSEADGLDIYFASEKTLRFFDYLQDISELPKNHEKELTFLYELHIMYGNMYIEKLKYIIKVINEMFYFLETNWFNNITTAISSIEDNLDKIIFYKKKTEFEETYDNKKIKYTIKKELEDFKHDFNIRIRFLKMDKKTAITTMEDIISHIEGNVLYMEMKLEEKLEKNKSITEDKQFIGDFSGLLSYVKDEKNDFYMDKNNPHEEFHIPITFEQYCKELGDIFFKMYKIMNDERKQQKLDVEKSN